MHTVLVQMQTNWIATCPAWQDRSQKSILDPQDRCILPGGYLFTPPRGRALPPDTHHIAIRRRAKLDGIARKLKDAPHAALRQKPTVINEKPPRGPGGLIRVRGHVDQPPPPTLVARLPSAFTDPSEPVSAEMVLSQVTNGASVT